jgi:hypothetical protein
MAKPGRNDPCPCGSGKKYKQCCLGQERPLLTRLPEVIREERLKAEGIARRWLGEEETSSSALRDRRGRKLELVMDRFLLQQPQAVAEVRSLGRCEGERVLFCDGSEWIGEADFSQPGEMLLVTAGRGLADRLLALVQPISGLHYQGRQVDEMGDPESGQSSPGGGSELLAFKKTFFTAWLDEPNQKLDQATPRQASSSPQLKPKLLRLLADLERKEARLPGKERFDFSPLRTELGL